MIKGYINIDILFFFSFSFCIVENQGYFTGKVKKLNKKQRKSQRKKRESSGFINGRIYLPLENYRELKKYFLKSIGRNPHEEEIENIINPPRPPLLPVQEIPIPFGPVPIHSYQAKIRNRLFKEKKLSLDERF